MKTFIEAYPGAVPAELCNSILQRFKKLKSLDAGLESHTQYNSNRAIRSDYAIFFEAHAPDLAAEFFGFLQQTVDLYKVECPGLSDIGFNGYAMKVQETMRGGGYHSFHCEQGSGAGVRDRILVWTAFLNTVKEGGELEFLNQSVRLHPEQGTIVIFPAAFTHQHRGNPPLGDETKYIATGWWSCL